MTISAALLLFLIGGEAYWAEAGWTGRDWTEGDWTGGDWTDDGGVVVPMDGEAEEVDSCTTGANGTSPGEAIDVGEGGTVDGVALTRGTAACG